MRKAHHDERMDNDKTSLIAVDSVISRAVAALPYVHAKLLPA